MDIGFYTSLLTLLCGVPPMLLLRSMFQKQHTMRRVLLACFLAGFYCLAGIGWSIVLRGGSPSILTVQVMQLLYVIGMTGIFIKLNEFIHKIHFVRMEAERLSTITELSSLFAHEIRNPMQTTRGFLQLLDDPELSAKKRQFIKLSIG